MAKISIEALAVSYGNTRVITELNLEIPDGSLFTLLGPSGCGKTTLLRTIAGFIPVEEGRMRFGERDVTRLAAHQRDIGMVFQDYALFPDKTVFDNVAYGLRARKIDAATIKKKVGEYLERVGLGPYGARHPAALSGGQRQRVALARALVIQPQVLLMDEPLSNLDAKLRIQVRETIADLQKEAGITTVFVTHDQEEALALSDKIGLMKSGKLEQIGTPTDIYREPVSAYVADFVGAANIMEIEIAAHDNIQQPMQLEFEGSRLTARGPRLLPAGKASLVARPEDLTMALAKKALPNGVLGKVARKQYLGGKTHYGVTLASGRSLAVSLHGPDHFSFDEGSSVAVSFDPLKTLVVAA
jgi:iron(III) transport system ATP-binding protein